MTKERVAKIRKLLGENNLDGVLISKPENRAYYSGFTGTAGMLVITPQNTLLLTDFRYIGRATQEASQFQVIAHAVQITDTLKELVHQHGIKRLAFEADFVSYQQYQTFREQLPDVELVPQALDKCRMVKDERELAIISHAVKLADDAFQYIAGKITSGMTERAVALELEWHMRQNGAEKAAFDFIVASGPRGALPHGVASDRVLAEGDMVTVDFGCVYRGYHSDLTRTVILGHASDRQLEIYNLVLQAQLAALAGIRPGMKACEADKIARDIITAAGYGEYFGHGLGHGVGLAIHEEPRLSAQGDVVLEPGMVVTVEPGIYIPQWGGVRIEDTVVITHDGCRPLSQSTKELLVL